MDDWGACTVTGGNMPEVLRSSHAKPWADCDADAERLDVFNGFLLIANFDALFDRGLISFDDSGVPLISPRLAPEAPAKLGLTADIRLRWQAPEHAIHLAWYHEKVLQAG
ncbi:MAG: HNH endonuclease signature motif containing protein [Pseudomonadota bacterium]|jgi:putative restriction endonuclease